MDNQETVAPLKPFNHISSLIAGGVAGLVVDIFLFPIDTLKTRLQSERGFWKTGGFRNVYKGLVPVATGSAPTAALFFYVYEGCKYYLSVNSEISSPFIHMFSASVAEIAACIIRVPVEIAKQRRQTLNIKSNSSAFEILLMAYRTKGFFSGLYRGYGTTVLREIPFSFIQFPLWEYFKSHWNEYFSTPLEPWSVAICGAVAGGISAGVTTPLDVTKTRIMLADYSNNVSSLNTFKSIYKNEGIVGLFSGIVPRVIWISFGGAIFFGSYEFTMRLLNDGKN